MRSRTFRLVLALVIGQTLAATAAADAQVLGVFRWQMQPYCNRVTMTIVQQGPAYQLNGSDDLCGGANVAPATGTATVNPNGTIALGFDIVVPTGASTHVIANVNLANVSGTWVDDSGLTGTFAYNPGSVSGAPRPAPTRSVQITSAQLAASIFAGTGAATTIARSDHTHDDRYMTRPTAVSTTITNGLTLDLGTWEGVGVQAFCGPLPYLRFSTTGNNLRIGGTGTTTTTGAQVFTYFGASGVILSGGASSHFIGTARNTATGGRLVQFNLSIGAGTPCRVDGVVGPVD